MAYDTDVFIYDLMHSLRSDKSRLIAVEEALRRVDNVTRAVQDGKATRADLVAAQADVVKTSGFNFGLLIKTMFPRFIQDGADYKPLSFLDRPFMFTMTCLSPNSTVTLKAGRQVGKCTTGDTKVELRNGTATMLDIFDSAA